MRNAGSKPIVSTQYQTYRHSSSTTFRGHLPVCGARQPLRLTEQACVLPTAAHAFALLYLPPAAQGNAAPGEGIYPYPNCQL